MLLVCQGRLLVPTSKHQPLNLLDKDLTTWDLRTTAHQLIIKPRALKMTDHFMMITRERERERERVRHL